MNYLVSLNQNLNQLDTSQLLSNAQKSLIRKKLKKMKWKNILRLIIHKQ